MDPFDAFATPETAQTAGTMLHGVLQPWQRAREGDPFAHSDPRTWDQELPRWLATLNPGRTGHEYEKALRYFFDTPGVPQQLTAISFDLLLAYRGALALRAASRDRPQSARGRGGVSAAFDAQLAAPWTAALPPHDAESADAHRTATWQHAPSDGLLAPATVNLRLTALRQFLVHCALLELLASLTPDRIRAALRRVHIERRRPYQVLAEAEWGAFLQAALAPADGADGADGAQRVGAVGSEAVPSSTAGRQATRGPWGVSRAARAALLATAEQQACAGAESTGAESPAPVRPHSRAGLTGARTAPRDHALLSLALATGLRAIELVSLDVGDLVREWHEGREEWWLVLPDAKTKGQRGGRTLPLAPTLVETLLAYVRATGRRWEQANDRQTPLFLSRRARRRDDDAEQGRATRRSSRHRSGEARLSTTQVRAIVDRVEAQWSAAHRAGPLGAAGIAGESRAISPHALRHSTALALLEGDGAARPPASVEHVRGWLGHFDIRTTQGYLAHLDARRHRRPFVLDTFGGARASAEQAAAEQAAAAPAPAEQQPPQP